MNVLMDFLDPHKRRRHALLLYTGYIFIGVAVLFSALVLVYQANGFGVNSKGEVVQNGLVFVSSQPNPADIYLNGVKNDAKTNIRLSLPSGSYAVRLAREGYRDWNRNINVQGGDVQNFDYPFLIPRELDITQEAVYAAAPSLVTQSRDRRWLLVQEKVADTSFTAYDLNKEKLEPESIALPTGLTTAANGVESWEAIQWANDNQRLLVKHTYDSGYEYLIINRTKPAESVNLNKTLNVNPGKLTLIDNKYDQYHILVDGTLSSASLSDPKLTKLLDNVIDYKSYRTDTVLYATAAAGGETDKTSIALLDAGRDYTIRQVAKSATYPLDIASYRGDIYVVAGASSENAAYIYKNPVQQLSQSSVLTAAADRALRINGATHISFSPNTQFILAENGQNFAVYDLFLQRPYAYQAEQPLDAPQQHAEWMDGYHLTYVSGGKQSIFDYDRRNRQTLSNTLPSIGSQFSQDYRYAFSIIPDQTGAATLSRTNLRIKADL